MSPSYVLAVPHLLERAVLGELDVPEVRVLVVTAQRPLLLDGEFKLVCGVSLQKSAAAYGLPARLGLRRQPAQDTWQQGDRNSSARRAESKRFS